MKTALERQNIVNQSENCYGWDNYTDYELSIAIHSIKCFEMQDTNEKLRLTCGVTAAHCHWSCARSESDDWPVHTRFKGKLNSWHQYEQVASPVHTKNNMYWWCHLADNVFFLYSPSMSDKAVDAVPRTFSTYNLFNPIFLHYSEIVSI